MIIYLFFHVPATKHDKKDDFQKVAALPSLLLELSSSPKIL